MNFRPMFKFGRIIDYNWGDLVNWNVVMIESNKRNFGFWIEVNDPVIYDYFCKIHICWVQNWFYWWIIVILIVFGWLFFIFFNPMVKCSRIGILKCWMMWWQFLILVVLDYFWFQHWLQLIPSCIEEFKHFI